ncbi:MAG: hypothetical protein ACPG7R_09010, partial [Planctomycetota bacterium]
MAKRKKPAKRGAAAKKTPMAKKSKAKAPSTAGGIGVVCSECYSDFLYVQKSSGNQLTCPACGHTGITPDGAEVQRMVMAKATESKAYLTAVVPGVLFVLVVLYYLLQLNDGSLSSGLNY